MAECDRLFVYGTLLPGHLRWPMLAGRALDHQPGSVPGRLLDTGRGWPAATFGPVHGGGGGRVPGSVVRFAPGALDSLLPALDAMEGISRPPDAAADPYERIVVAVELDGGDDAASPDAGARAVEAWAYHALRVDPAWRQIDAWTDQPEA
jgi:gamma-glutamylcyclotransferase (GGCT)/AIG2-like uncharacterized protein YtfP